MIQIQPITNCMMSILLLRKELDMKFSKNKLDYSFFVSPSTLIDLSMEEVNRKSELSTSESIFSSRKQEFNGYKIIIVSDMENTEIYFGRKYKIIKEVK